MPHTKTPSWEARQVESFGRLKIDSGNPELGNDGASVYGIVAEGESGNTSYLGMTEGGQYHIFNDKCFNITGGVKGNSGQVAINIISPHGDICITAQQNGEVKISGKNITIDATDTLTFEANKCNFNVTGMGGIDFNTPRLHADPDIARHGNLITRDVKSFGGVCFDGSKVGAGDVLSAMSDVNIPVKRITSQVQQVASFVESPEFAEGISQATQGLNDALSNFPGFG